jgi:CDP-diacylglycerol--glycerol-3-phosphate 3-phosphatidyltransferase
MRSTLALRQIYRSMTIANYITILRIMLIPVFAILAWLYGQSVLRSEPIEYLRYLALAVFTIAAAGDALDGYIARKLNQRTKLGAYLDPVADKFLMFAAIILLSWVPWGENDWQIPSWFAWMVIIRDLSIGTAVAIIYLLNQKVIIRVNICSKLNTIAQLFTIGWVMLKLISISPIYPTMVCAFLILLSSYHYTLESIRQLIEDAPRCAKPADLD